MVEFDENGKIKIEALCRGDTLSEAIVRRILDCQVGTAEFRTGVVYLSERIETRLWKLGRPWLVVAEGGELRILTDGETSTCMLADFRTSLQSLLKCNEAMRGVDTSKFDAKERVAHEQEPEFQKCTLDAIGASHKEGRQRRATRRDNTKGADELDSYDGPDGWKQELPAHQTPCAAP